MMQPRQLLDIKADQRAMTAFCDKRTSGYQPIRPSQSGQIVRAAIRKPLRRVQVIGSCQVPGSLRKHSQETCRFAFGARDGLQDGTGGVGKGNEPFLACLGHIRSPTIPFRVRLCSKTR